MPPNVFPVRIQRLYMADLLVEDARIVSPRGIRVGDLAVTDGTVEAVGRNLAADYPDPDEHIAADGRVVMPGIVDVHNHLHDPGLFPDAFDFATGTESAVAGGVTTVVELPTQTEVTTPSAIREKREACEQLAHADFGLIAGNCQDADVDVEGLLRAGVPDLKTFFSEPYRADDRTVIALMDRVGRAGGTVRVHCETQGILDHARAQIDGSDPDVYPDSRPLEAELDAISRAGWFAEYTNCPLHVVHISSGSGAREGARFASRSDVPITLETCPHYLAFSTEDIAELGPFLKVNPSIKSPQEVERLWEAVADGTIDLIASEHFPTHADERATGWDDIWEPYAGLPGIETMLEFLVSEGVHAGRLSWGRLCELVCERPARESGLFPRKGTLRPGADADLVLLRDESYHVTPTDLTFNGGWTPYEGREWTARVETVVRGGQVVARDHEVVTDPGDGAFLPRGPGAEDD